MNSILRRHNCTQIVTPRRAALLPMMLLLMFGCLVSQWFLRVRSFHRGFGGSGRICRVLPVLGSDTLYDIYPRRCCIAHVVLESSDPRPRTRRCPIQVCDSREEESRSSRSLLCGTWPLVREPEWVGTWTATYDGGATWWWPCGASVCVRVSCWHAAAALTEPRGAENSLALPLGRVARRERLSRVFSIQTDGRATRSVKIRTQKGAAPLQASVSRYVLKHTLAPSLHLHRARSRTLR